MRPTCIRLRAASVSAALFATIVTSAAVLSPASVEAAPAAGASASTYVVQSGDTLIGIARRAGVTLGALLRANEITATSLIVPGQRLALPAGARAVTPAANRRPTPATPPATGASTYTVRAGDTLSGIAARHQVRLGALLASNRFTVTSLILPGMRVQLPAGAVAAASPPPVTKAAPAAPTASGGMKQVVDFALAQEGKPYRFFSAGPDYFDCSGLTKAAFAQAGVTLVHQSAAQARQGRAVDLATETIQPGDLVFMSLRGSDTINHVGIAISSTRWIQATRAGEGARIGPIPHPSMITTVRRITVT